jgi:hypothetical protein
MGAPQGSDPCSDFAGLADSAEAMDRADSGHDKMAHLLDNLGADGVRFTAEEVRELNTALAGVPIHGVRLSAGLLRLSGVEAAPKQ